MKPGRATGIVSFLIALRATCFAIGEICGKVSAWQAVSIILPESGKHRGNENGK
jgi:hypothetical protein